VNWEAARTTRGIRPEGRCHLLNIDAPWPQCLRHGDPMHARKQRLTGRRGARSTPGMPAPRGDRPAHTCATTARDSQPPPPRKVGGVKYVSYHSHQRRFIFLIFLPCAHATARATRRAAPHDTSRAWLPSQSQACEGLDIDPTVMVAPSPA
jgi:hypothetical protein